MKAIVFRRYGSPDVLEVAEIERPRPGANEVLVRVHAASINDWDYGAMLGGDFVNRLIFGLSRPHKHPILGSDIAGVVEAIGGDVKRFKPGDEVFGDLSGVWGGFAEYVCARETMLAWKPQAMSFEEAAAIPQAAMLAVQALHDAGHLKDTRRLLINGAGGGVGTFAIQLAKLRGCYVAAVDRGDKLEMLRALGADRVVDYMREDITRSGESFDLILDVKTSRSVADWARVLRHGGTYVSVGGSTFRLLQALLLKPFLFLVRKVHIGVVVLKPNKDLALMGELYEGGKVKPVIDSVFDLGQLSQAMRHFGAAEHKGKIVIAVTPH